MATLGGQSEPRLAGSFVGRERELADLLAGLRDLAGGHGHLFLLSGEPGIGKTRLADEFGRLALERGIRMVWGRCWEEGGAPAYRPWIQVLRACLAGSDAEQRAAILGAEGTPQFAQNMAHLLPELRTAHAPTPRYSGLHPPNPEQPTQACFEPYSNQGRQYE